MKFILWNFIMPMITLYSLRLNTGRRFRFFITFLRKFLCLYRPGVHTGAILVLYVVNMRQRAKP